MPADTVRQKAAAALAPRVKPCIRRVPLQRRWTAQSLVVGMQRAKPRLWNAPWY